MMSLQETSHLLGNLTSSSSGLKALSMGGYTGSSKTLQLPQGAVEEASQIGDLMAFHEKKSPPQLAVDNLHIPARHADSRNGVSISNRGSSMIDLKDRLFGRPMSGESAVLL